MRPIKFRAWDGKKMVEPGYITPSGWFENFRGLEDGDRSEGPLMQFTGLLDSQGVEIWEGDIVRWDDASKGRYWRVAEVVWHEVGAWCYRTIPGSCTGALTSYSVDFKMGSFIYTPDSSKYGNFLEVLGNVRQNPELLK